MGRGLIDYSLSKMMSGEGVGYSLSKMMSGEGVVVVVGHEWGEVVIREWLHL